MRFFTQVIFGAEGNEVGKSTTSYATMDEAEQAFHVAIASAIGRVEYAKVIAIIFDADGVVVMRRVWERGM